MKDFLIRLPINIITIFLAVCIVTGGKFISLESAIAAAVLFGLLNTFLRPFLLALTLPINIMTVGFFTLFINGFLFYVTARLVHGLNIVNFWSAFWAALLFSIISALFNIAIFSAGNVRINSYNYSCRKHKDEDIIDVEAKVEDHRKE